QCAMAQGVARPRVPIRTRDRLVHRDKPLRCVAEDHGFLGTPGMRVLVLESPARDQHAGIDKRFDDGLVGVTLVAPIGDDPLRLAAGVAGTEARRLIGEEAVAVDRIGDRSVESLRREITGVRSPDVEIVATMARRCMHETGAGVVGYMFTRKKWN